MIFQIASGKPGSLLFCQKKRGPPSRRPRILNVLFFRPDYFVVVWPVPVSGTVCGLSPALSVTDTLALSVPVVAGVNVTTMVQLFFGATEVPQLLVWEKSVGLVPVSTMLLMVMASPPLASVRVMFCGVLLVPTVCAAKVKLVGENDAAVLVPASVTVKVPALVVMVKVAARWLILVGLKVTLIVQLLLAARDAPQLLVCEKSPGSAPPMAMLEIVMADVVPLLSVTVCAALVVPSTCSA